jgi:hypothetical protein
VKYAQPVPLAKLWLLAEWFLVPALQNYVMGFMPQLCWMRETLTEFAVFVNETCVGDTLLRRFAADLLVTFVPYQPIFHTMVYDLPREILAEITVVISKELVIEKGLIGWGLPGPQTYLVEVPSEKQ